MFVALRSHKNIRFGDGSFGQVRGKETGRRRKGTIYSCNVVWIKHEAPKKLEKNIRRGQVLHGAPAEEEKILKNYYFERQARLLNTFLLLLFSHHLNDDRWLAASPSPHPSRYQQQLTTSMRSELTINRCSSTRLKDTAINRYMRALSFARPIHKMPGRRTQKTFRKIYRKFYVSNSTVHTKSPLLWMTCCMLLFLPGFWYAENNLIHISTPLALSVSVCRCFRKSFRFNLPSSCTQLVSFSM